MFRNLCLSMNSIDVRDLYKDLLHLSLIINLSYISYIVNCLTWKHICLKIIVTLLSVIKVQIANIIKDYKELSIAIDKIEYTSLRFC